ncbi:hypothetical protein SDC9_95843 [bioreactor metagenome]|uniref:Fold protein n=1 Tax=bioreactor metagenome TaxID=1076179 RepID=A0A645A7E8_9ZZZZ
MYKIACTRKEASCIIGNFFGELVPICEYCKGLEDDELLLLTTDGLLVRDEGRADFRGHSSITGEPAEIKLTDYGFEFFGDITEITRIRETRCLYIGQQNHTPKEG